MKIYKIKKFILHFSINPLLLILNFNNELKLNKVDDQRYF